MPVEQTKSAIAYSHIRKQIVTGEIAPGDPIEEMSLSEQLGIGRTPVREALKRMESEGLITWLPHRSPAVSELSLHDLSRLYELRLLIEQEAARQAALRRSPASEQKLVTLVEELRVAIRSATRYEVVEIDYRLHNAIAEASDNRFIADAVARFNLPSMRLWYQAIADRDPVNMFETHAEIVDAIVAGDEQLAAQHVVKHVNGSFDSQLRSLGLRRSEDITVPIAI